MVAPDLAKRLGIANALFSLRCVKRKQRASALQLFMYSDKDQFYMCVVGVPHLETAKTVLIVFSIGSEVHCVPTNMEIREISCRNILKCGDNVTLVRSDVTQSD